MHKTALAILLAGVATTAQQPQPADGTALPATGGTANTAANPTRQISLADAVQMALQSNLDIQILRYNPKFSEYALSEAYAVYEPSLRMDTIHSASKLPGGFDQFGNPYPSQIIEGEGYGADIGTGVAGYAPSGLTYRIGGQLDKTSRRFQGSQASVDEYTGGLTLSATQPLLRNFWIDPARATLQISRRNLRISEEQLRQQIMNTLLAVEQAYYNLIFARENVRVQATALELASQLLRENKKRVEVGALAPLDEKQAEAEVASTKAALIDAERGLSEQQNIFKSLITDHYAEWNAVNIEPVETLVAVPSLSDVQASWGHGLNKRADLQQLKYELEKTGITLKLRKNQIYPQLDLTGSYGHAERGTDFADVLGDLPRGTNPRYSFGVILDIPLGNRAARARYRGAKADKDMALLEYKRLEQQIMVQVDDAVKLIRSSFERVEATRAARAFAQEALAAEQKKLENGKSTSFFVLQFQRDLTVRRFDEIRALAEYNNAVALLAHREGTTLERHKVAVR